MFGLGSVTLYCHDEKNEKDENGHFLLLLDSLHICPFHVWLILNSVISHGWQAETSPACSASPIHKVETLVECNNGYWSACLCVRSWLTTMLEWAINLAVNMANSWILITGGLIHATTQAHLYYFPLTVKGSWFTASFHKWLLFLVLSWGFAHISRSGDRKSRHY